MKPALCLHTCSLHSVVTVGGRKKLLKTRETHHGGWALLSGTVRHCQALNHEEVLAELRQLCYGGFMARVCMKRGDLSLGMPAQGLETLELERNWLRLLLGLSAPAQAHPGLPGVGGPGPGL